MNQDTLPSPTDLLTNPVSLRLLMKLRETDMLTESELASVSMDDRAYLQTELCVRKAAYSKVDELLPADASEWVKAFSRCYRDLFNSPQKAYDALAALEASCPPQCDLPLRLKFWRIDLDYVLGRISEAESALSVLMKESLFENIWKAEILGIIALGMGLTGKTRQALVLHRECQRLIDREPDLFLQTFNSAMAARGALKICDAEEFEFFSQKLQDSLTQNDDTRYRLRHTGYRAMILNQLSEHEAAERYWAIGDALIDKTESALERSQYLILRAVSLAMTSKTDAAASALKAARADLEAAGTPPAYLAELEIARALLPIANPLRRGIALRDSLMMAEYAGPHLEHLASQSPAIVRELYSEAAIFCRSLISGSEYLESPNGRCSIVLSVIENASRSSNFAAGLSHFRLVPNFVHAASQVGLSAEALSSAVESVTKVRPVVEADRLTLPKGLQKASRSPELTAVLDLASTFLQLGQKSDRLFAAEARLRETTRATTLLHDLVFFASELSRVAQQSDSPTKILKFAGYLEKLIEDHLQSLRTGTDPTAPSIVSVSKVLARAVTMAEETTGKKVVVDYSSANLFCWLNEARLHRMLLNLIKNGLEAGNGNEPVTVRCEPNGDSLSIYISDNGPGIPAEIVRRARDKDAGEVTTDKLNGHGYGLKSAFECAETLGARISPSVEAVGTTFKVEFPMPTMTDAASDSAKVLVIDDSEAVLDSWRSYEAMSAIGIIAMSPEQAVAVLNQAQNRLKWVVLDYDLKLTSGNGADLAEPISKLGIKVALSSGYQPDELPADARAVRWDAIITKEPQNPDGADRKSLPANRPEAVTPLSAQASLRHDIRNELTTLKQAFRYLKSTAVKDSKASEYINLFGRGIEGIERVVNPDNQNTILRGSHGKQ